MKTIWTPLQHGKDGNVPKLIVIHAMGEFVRVKNRRLHAVKFLDEWGKVYGKSYGLSAHALGAPSGLVYRCRTDIQTAYHAAGHNDDSLGYEVLVEGEHDYGTFLDAIKTPYVTETQFQSVLDQVRSWLNDHDTIRRIARHSDLSPERKVDPGDGFPWGDFLHDLGWSE